MIPKKTKEKRHNFKLRNYLQTESTNNSNIYFDFTFNHLHKYIYILYSSDVVLSSPLSSSSFSLSLFEWSHRFHLLLSFEASLEGLTYKKFDDRLPVHIASLFR